MQSTILNTLREKLHADPSFLQQALAKQVKPRAGEAIAHFGRGAQVKLVELLDSVSPMAAVLLNIEISLVNSAFMEQGNTLSRTLLPYLNAVTDFSFLPRESDFIVGRFLAALASHISDTKGAIGLGYAILALKINPALIQNILSYQSNGQHLMKALELSAFSKASAELFARYPSKLLWPQLLAFLQGKAVAL